MLRAVLNIFKKNLRFYHTRKQFFFTTKPRITLSIFKEEILSATTSLEQASCVTRR